MWAASRNAAGKGSRVSDPSSNRAGQVALRCMPDKPGESRGWGGTGWSGECACPLSHKAASRLRGGPPPAAPAKAVGPTVGLHDCVTCRDAVRWCPTSPREGQNVALHTRYSWGQLKRGNVSTTPLPISRLGES